MLLSGVGAAGTWLVCLHQPFRVRREAQASSKARLCGRACLCQGKQAGLPCKVWLMAHRMARRPSVADRMHLHEHEGPAAIVSRAAGVQVLRSSSRLGCQGCLDCQAFVIEPAWVARLRQAYSFSVLAVGSSWPIKHGHQAPERSPEPSAACLGPQPRPTGC